MTPLMQALPDTPGGDGLPADPTGLPIGLVRSVVALCAVACVLLLLSWAAYRLAMPILIERMGG